MMGGVELHRIADDIGHEPGDPTWVEVDARVSMLVGFTNLLRRHAEFQQHHPEGDEQA